MGAWAVLPAASAISRLQAQLCWEGEVWTWQVCTTLLPAQGPSNAISSGSDHTDPRSRGGGAVHL